MAILIGATSSKTFADGFREGYKSIMGTSAAIPEVPSAKRKEDGWEPYLSGVASGIAAALKRKASEPSR
jgi:hypothetical protein